MSNLLRVCLYNTDPESSRELTDPIRALNFVRLVAEVGNPDNLATALQEHAVNLVFFHLDPDPDPVVDVIDELATRYPELPLIALSHQMGPDAILAPMRAGCDQFVCEPIDPADLASAVSRVTSKRLLATPRSRCICITGSTGGAGSTSIACNLALEIGNVTGRDCALIDLDIVFGDVALNFDCEPKYDLNDLAVAGADLDDSILSSALKTLPCKVSILSRPEIIGQYELITADTIHRVIEMLKRSYEHIVIDTPRDLNAWTTAALANADLIFIVCQLLVPSIRNAKRYYDILLQMGIPDERLEFIVNRTDGRSGRVTVKDIEASVKKPVFACIPNDYQFVARSIDFGRPIAALDRNSPVRAAIATMAKRVTAGAKPKSGEKDQRRGFLGRFLAK